MPFDAHRFLQEMARRVGAENFDDSKLTQDEFPEGSLQRMVFGIFSMAIWTIANNGRFDKKFGLRPDVRAKISGFRSEMTNKEWTEWLIKNAFIFRLNLPENAYALDQENEAKMIAAITAAFKTLNSIKAPPKDKSHDGGAPAAAQEAKPKKGKAQGGGAATAASQEQPQTKPKKVKVLSNKAKAAAKKREQEEAAAAASAAHTLVPITPVDNWADASE